LKLDIRTILLITAFMGPLMAVVLLSLRRNYPVSVRGLGWWANGSLVIFVGIVLIAARGMLPDVGPVFLGNTLMITGSMMWVLGTERFLGRPSRIRPLSALVAVASALLAYFLWVQPSYEGRVAVVNGAMIILAVLHSHCLVQYNRFEFAGRFLVLSLMASACAWLAQGAGAMSGYTQGNAFAPNGFNAGISATLTVCTLLTLIGFVLLASERVRDEFERLATKDSLTGALMRRAWDSAAQLELDRCRRHGRALSLVAMDLDHFKHINDTYGHLAGDKALVDFVAQANLHLRRQDQLGRLGGEEFVLLLPETSQEEALVVAERIRAATEAATTTPHFTVSMGVATLLASDMTLQHLMSRADAAMYRAKDQGRNRVVTQ
jgi:diguanylate cyclase (GGDEF)-like protein